MNPPLSKNIAIADIQMRVCNPGEAQELTDDDLLLAKALFKRSESLTNSPFVGKIGAAVVIFDLYS